MRLLALVAVIAIACALPVPAGCVELSTGITLGPPTFELERAEVLQVTRSCAVSLPAGETVLALPFSELGVDPATAVLEVIPAATVRVAAMEIAAGAQAVRWHLDAAGPTDAEVRITCGMKGLTWSVDYELMLKPDGGLNLSQSLTVANGLGRSFDNAILIGPVSAAMPLRDGERVTRQTVSLPIAPQFVERSVVYDKSRHGDAPAELLTILPPEPVRDSGLGHGIPIIGRLFRAQRAPLEPGSARILSATDTGADFIGTTSIPYVPAGEPLELKLGTADGVMVTRTREKATEVNVRKDAHNKTAAYDVDEEWRFEVRNLRASPLVLTIVEHPEGTWQVQRASLAHEKRDATTLAFTMLLDPGERAELTYLLRLRNLQP